MTLYDYEVTTNKGDLISLADYKDQVLLIVNTATGCGFTPQYKGLQDLYDTYQAQGFTILDFPSNQFGGQAPGTAEEIADFCEMRYHTTFPQFAKVDVNGENALPLYDFLKSEQHGTLTNDIKWNFTKFLVDRDGNVVKRYGSAKKPESIAADLKKLL
ncbi:glutathione peroxidase [Pseudolactococcus insecticola]|uniref:Glutathione peroxidase n=1 Tax=Pseudolactococcus insecticola TaxID=2709158 RepID=A0A6A0B5L7_9LACT|nr:glutathione peroxidase [Lactococcus insecticola]GFH40719.1 glutathione peroxidase [Lactococcus insecticola]